MAVIRPMYPVIWVSDVLCDVSYMETSKYVYERVIYSDRSVEWFGIRPEINCMGVSQQEMLERMYQSRG